jgi:hypothetical protein
LITLPPLTPSQVAALLRAAADSLRAEAGGLGDEAMRWHPAPEEWCVNEVIGHLIEAEERGFAGRIRRIIERPGRHEPDWDPPEVARERNDCARAGAALLREFASLREESVRLVEGLADEQLDLAREHPLVGTLRVRDVLHEWPHHDRTHIMQAMAVVQATVWPHMGNAQRFSEID